MADDVGNKKYALLIGINYTGTDSQLMGCCNDASNMRSVLIQHYGYDSNNIVLMTDTGCLIGNKLHDIKPTKENILLYFRQLMQNKTQAQLFFHFSGHGTYFRDINNDEDDNRDECLVPLDYNQNGLIIDDVLRLYISKFLHPTTTLTAIIDACHSGTALDLKYEINCTSLPIVEQPSEKYDWREWTAEYTLKQSSQYSDYGNILMISGCRDYQTSADAYISSSFQGALSATIQEVLKTHNYRVKLKILLKDVHCLLYWSQFSQKPVLSSSKFCNLNSEFLH